MERSRKDRKKRAKKRIEESIKILEEQIEKLNIDLKELSSSESESEQSLGIEVGAQVESTTYPWYNGTVEYISKDNYWIYIKIGGEVRRKARHNVKVVAKKDRK